MTVQFGNNRLAFYVVVMLLSGAVLGLSAHFANLFKATFMSGFFIFSLVVASLQIFIFLLALQWSQPRVESVILFVFGVLWLAEAAWATDIIGPVQCSELTGTVTTKNKGDFSYATFCKEMKVIQAFSWALFAMFTIALIVLFQLIGEARKFGRWNITKEPIRELPWYGEAPGYYNQHTQGPPTGQYPYPMPQYPYPTPVSAGTTTIIQPGINGQPPHITHI